MAVPDQSIGILGQRLIDAASAFGSALSGEGNESRAADLMRMRSILEYVEARVASADLDLALPGSVANIDGSVNAAMGELQSYQSNGNAGHIANAANNLHNALRYSNELPLPMALLGVAYPAQAVESLRASAEQSLVAVGSARESVTRDFTQLQGKVDSLTQIVEKQTTRLDTALTEQQAIFQKAQEERLTSNATAMTEVADKAQALRTQLDDDASEVMGDMARMRDQAQELLHIIGNTGMAGEYAKTANRSRTTALVWQGIAAVSLIALVGFALHAYQAITDSAAGVSQILGRVFVAATFGVLAAYASRQADQAQRIEERNRRYALVLSSIDPYLADLEPAKRTDVKIELAKTLFTQTGSETIATTEEAFDGNAKDFMQLLIQLANAFKSAK
ncbi:MAG: hypothetical protein WBW32_03855 [Luteibacter sp.]